MNAHSHFCWQYTSQERPMRECDYTIVIAIVHWHLCTETHPGDKVVSTVIIFVFPLAAIACFNSVGN